MKTTHLDEYCSKLLKLVHTKLENATVMTNIVIHFQRNLSYYVDQLQNDAVLLY